MELRRACETGLVLIVVAGVGYIGAVQAPSAQRSRPVPGRAAPAQAVTVEFDAPADASARAADGSPALRGFQVGYFGNAADPLKTVDVAMDVVTVRGNTMRVRVPLTAISDREMQTMIRIRSLSAGGSSAWSEPVGPVTLPSFPSVPARSVSSADLDQRPALKESLSELLGQGCSEADARAAFERVQDMAMAVVLVRKHGLSFPRLCSLMKGPPRVPVTHALQALNPSLDLREEVRVARRDARGLLAARRGTRR